MLSGPHDPEVKRRSYRKRRLEGYRPPHPERSVQRAARWNQEHHVWRNIRRFGLSLDAYQTLLQVQNGRCAICGRLPEEQRGRSVLSVDHDHVAGRVRGLLCNNCNRGLGLLGDTFERIEAACKYLRGK